MPGSRNNKNGSAAAPKAAAADAESESNRIVLEQAALTINRVQDVLTRIPAPVRGGTR